MKLLPFYDNVIIKTYPYISFYLGILEGNGIDISDLIIKEFSHVFFFRKKLDFTASGFFHKKYFFFRPIRRAVKKNMDTIIQEIDAGHYVVIILNEKYINHDFIKTEFDHFHDWLIYGYDELERVFYCAGYLGKRPDLRSYGTIKVSYNEIECALEHDKINHYTLTSKDTHATWIKKRPTVNLDLFGIKSILKKIADPPYLGLYYRPLIRLDMRAVKSICLDIEQKAAHWSSLKDKRVWLQSFRVLYEQIAVFKLMTAKFIKSPEINQELELLDSNAYTLLLLVGRYNIKPNEEHLKEISSLLNMLYEKEQELFLKMRSACDIHKEASPY